MLALCLMDLVVHSNNAAVIMLQMKRIVVVVFVESALIRDIV